MGITIVPFHFNRGEESIKDDPALDRPAMFNMMRDHLEEYTTAGVNKEDVAGIYERLSADGSSVVDLCISRDWSPTYDISLQAAEQLRGRDITVVDTRVAAGGLAGMALEAGSMALQGATVGEIVSTIEELKPLVADAMILDTLSHLARIGRIQKAKALLGIALRIKPIVGYEDGYTVPLGKVRTHSQGLEWVVRYIRKKMEATQTSAIRRLFVHDADNPEWARKARQRLLEEFEVQEVWLQNTPVVFVVAIGLGVWGVGFQLTRRKG
jgi:DegV family protein with EDD domain